MTQPSHFLPFPGRVGEGGGRCLMTTSTWECQPFIVLLGREASHTATALVTHGCACLQTSTPAVNHPISSPEWSTSRFLLAKSRAGPPNADKEQHFSFYTFRHNLLLVMLQSRSWQTFSVQGQRVNISGSLIHRLSDTQALWNSCSAQLLWRENALCHISVSNGNVPP